MSMTCSSRIALTGDATAAAILSSALSLICEDEADFTSRFGRGIAFRSLLGDVGDGVAERERELGREELSEDAPFAQLLTKRKLFSI